MEVRHIRQFSQINGVRKNPSSAQHGKYVKWNNNSGFYEYSCIGVADIEDFPTIVDNDTYLSSVVRSTSPYYPNYGEFTMNDGTKHYLELGELAWLDELPQDKFALVLPGDQKILFDEADTIGGSSNFKYNYTTNRILTTDTKYFINAQEALSYSGTNSFYFGSGVKSPVEAGTRNVNVGYRAGYRQSSNSSDNVNIGPYAGDTAYTAMVGGINIGPHAGRYCNTNNEFYLDNTDYTDTATAKANSFLFADLATERRLKIRDRLLVEKEGKFGDSGIADGDGEEGMFQMLAVSAGVVKPQYYSNGIWNDFESSVDVYLADVTYLNGDLVFTMSDGTTIGPVDISDLLNDLTIPFATSPNSPATGKTANSDYGYLQISNSTFTDNEGFTYATGLYWQNTNKYLNIPGAVTLSTTTGTSYPNNSIFFDGTHFYGKIGGTNVQLDNDIVIGENIDGINIGGAAYEVFKQRTLDDLEFRTFQAMEIDPINNPHDRITFKYSSTGDAILVGTTAERNRLSTTLTGGTEAMIDKTTDVDGETLHIRALRQGSGVVLTQTENYIQIDAVTEGGGGEVNTCSNVGTIDFWYRKNGVDFEFYGLDTADSRIVFTPADGGNALYDNFIDLDLEIFGDTETVVTPTTYAETLFSRVDGGDGTTPTIYFKPILSDSISITTTVNDELLIELLGSPTVVSCDNVGTGAEIYVDSSTEPFEFRTLQSTQATDHITISENVDGLHIDFVVDDIVTNFLGTDTAKQLFTVNTDNWTIDQLGIDVKATSGLTLDSSSGTDIVIDQPIPIPYITNQYFFGDESLIYDNVGSDSDNIMFNANYSSDIRGGISAAKFTIFDLKLEGGLYYDVINNVLTTNLTPTGDTNFNLVEIQEYADPDNYSYLFHIKDKLGNLTAESPLLLEVPKTVVGLATYTDNVSPATGVVEIDKSIKTWTLGNTQQLNLDEVYGYLSIDAELVTYDAQNELYDIGNTVEINGKRETARKNIGAAYINGSRGVNFNALNLYVNEVFEAPTTDVEHSIGNLRVYDNEISGSTETSNIVIISGSSQGEQRIVSSISETRIVLNADTGGILTIYDSGGVKLFHLDSGGNMYLKGNIYAGGDIEALDTDNIIDVNITPPV